MPFVPMILSLFTSVFMKQSEGGVLKMVRRIGVRDL